LLFKIPGIVVLFLVGLLFLQETGLAAPLTAPALTIEYDLEETENAEFHILWDTAEAVTGFRLWYAPLLTISPIENIDMGLLTEFSMDLSALKATDGYFVAVQAYDDDGDSPLSVVRVLSAEGLVPSMLDQISQFLQQYNNYKFNQWISLGDLTRFQNRAYSDGFDVEISEDLGGDLARYYTKNLLVFGGYVVLSSPPQEMSSTTADPWHEMIHAIDDTSEAPFLLDDGIDSESHITWAEDVVKNSLGVNGLAGFEEYALANLDMPTDQLDPPEGNKTIAERARTRWNSFLNAMNPENYTYIDDDLIGHEVTQAHVVELRNLIGFDVDPEKIKQGYLDAGFPPEFFDEDPELRLIFNGEVYEEPYQGAIISPVGNSFFNRIYTVTNIGTGPITLNKFASSDTNFVVTGTEGLVLAPGAQTTVNVRFNRVQNIPMTTVTIGQMDRPEDDLTFDLWGLINYQGNYQVFSVDSSPDSALFECNGGINVLLPVLLDPNTFQYQLDYLGNDIRFFYGQDGSIFSNQFIQVPDGDGVTSENLSVGINVFGNISGSSTWTWVSSDGSESCSGTSSYGGSLINSF